MALFQGTSGDDTVTGGAGTDLLIGFNGNDLLDGGAGADTMIGDDGNDTYIVDNLHDVMIEALNEGIDTIQTGMTYSLNTAAAANIENLTLTGTGNFNGTGNALNNAITGNSGNNTLDGGLGADTMTGGGGHDTYFVDSSFDTVIGGTGTNTVFSSASWGMAEAASGTENLTLTGTGNINGAGNSLNNIITGNAGNNSLDGGAGADTLIGGGGADTYFIDNAGDVIVNGGAAGNIIDTGVSHTMETGIVNLDLRGSNLAVTITGDSSADKSILDQSQASNNVFHLGGGGFYDCEGSFNTSTIDGGTGFCQMDDSGFNNHLTFIVHSSASVVFSSNHFQDIVLSSVSWDADAGASSQHSEAISQTILTGTANINASGTTFYDDTITGNTGNNVLDGRAGADTMIGGGGNDTYFVDNAGDTVIGGAGTDTVQSTVSWNLGAANSTGTENLTLEFDGVNNGLTATGSTGDNTLSDGLASNNDVLIGGDGNDTYIVNSTTTTLFENPGEGTDTVLAQHSFTLAADFENLTLTGSALVGTGNSLDNIIAGNAFDNTLDGGAGNDTLDGGVGADTMTGGAGNDTFYVDDTGDVVLDTTGTDIVYASISFDLSVNPEIENLTLSGAGNINGIGNASDNIITSNSGVDSLTGGDGNDTYYVNNTADTISENPGEGADVVFSTVSFALSNNVENLTLTGTANINGTGNAGDNTITGNGGNNTLDGGGGNDMLIGGLGDDTYIATAQTTIVENPGEGIDTVRSDSDFTLAADFENLTLTGAALVGMGNSLDNIVTGDAGINTLDGGGGNDTLDGGAGGDTMIGGTGNDTFYVDNTGDVVTENTGEGADTVISSVNYALNDTNEVENLTLTGTALAGTGNALDNIITGNALANTLTGGGGNDTLVGGAGNDTMRGGTGNDTYFVDVATDVVIENTAEGTADTVNSSITYTIGANIENLVLTGAAAINGTGNASDNILTGNSANNSLSGLAGNDTLDGGAGVDHMNGGLGNDTFFVDNTGDVVTEASNQGTDLVETTINYTLAVNVENLTLLGTGNLNGTGNTLANTINGNAGDNTLNGLTGADHLIGNGGNDTFFVDNVGDIVTAGVGDDTISSTITWDLTGNTDVENLILTGTAALHGTGNALDNIITGNNGANVLNGAGGNDTLAGGLGHDTLTGGAGADVFVFKHADTVSAKNADTLTDFTTGAGHDALNIHDILQLGGVYAGGSLANFVHLTASGGNTIISVDANGTTGGSLFITMATLTGVSLASLTDADTMHTNGLIIT